MGIGFGKVVRFWSQITGSFVFALFRLYTYSSNEHSQCNRRQEKKKKKRKKNPILIENCVDWRGYFPSFSSNEHGMGLWESGCRGVLAQEIQSAKRVERRLGVLLNCYISEPEFVLDYELPGVALASWPKQIRSLQTYGTLGHLSAATRTDL